MPISPFSEFLATARAAQPQVLFVLGSGLGEIAQRIEKLAAVGFADLPEMTGASISGHKGRLTLGRWAGKPVLALEGRLHHYEGHSWETVTLPIRVAAQLGVKCAILTNAAGGIADFLRPQSLMAIRHHLELNRRDCCRQTANHVQTEAPADGPYSAHFRDRLLQAADRLNLTLYEGVYAAVTGPNYETPAEIRALKAWGADAVGMSTTREALAARDAGMQCAAISCITNRAAGLGTGAITHEDVLVNAAAVVDRLGDLLAELLHRLDD